MGNEKTITTYHGAIRFILTVATLLILSSIYCAKQVLTYSTPSGTIIVNTAVGSFSDDTGNVYADVSASATSTVTFRTQAVIEFQNVAGQKAHRFSIGDAICVVVRDFDQNTSSVTLETVSVVLVEPNTGDREILTLTETEPNSGVFRTCLQSNSGQSVMGDGIITVRLDSRIEATYTDGFDDTPTSVGSVLIDPFGVVFNSITGEPVQGAVVTLYDADGNQAVLPQPPEVPYVQINPQTTGANGAFQFEYLRVGSYYLDVTPGGSYEFPSVVADANLPGGFVIDVGSRGESFTLVEGMEPLNLDMPVDPKFIETLTAVKTANRNAASLGDVIRYSVSISNLGDSDVNAIVVEDVMPHGVQYLKGSSRLNGVVSPDPVVSASRAIAWNISGAIPPGGSILLEYNSSVGPDSHRGDGRNTVQAVGLSSYGVPVKSNIASHSLKISQGVFTTDGTIVGHVFHDLDGNGVRSSEELGIKDVLIYLEDGSRVKTDINGRFSFRGVRQGLHVLRVDEKSIPEGAELIPTSNRFLGGNNSQFVDMPPGGLIMANFAVAYNKADNKNSNLVPAYGREKSLSNSSSKPDELRDAADATVPDKKGDDPYYYEKQILRMDSAMEFLGPLNSDVLSSDRVNVLIKSPLDKELTLVVNGKKIDSGRIGKTITNPGGNAAIYEFVGVKLERGMDNKLEARAFGANSEAPEALEIVVSVVGPPVRILIEPQTTETPADGNSVVKVNLSLVDKNGHIAEHHNGLFTVSVSIGDIIDSDVDPNTLGMQIQCLKGRASFSIRSPLQAGESEISVSHNSLSETAQLFFSAEMRDSFIVGFAELKFGYGDVRGKTDYLRDYSRIDRDSYLDAAAAFFAKRRISADTMLSVAVNSRNTRDTNLFKSESFDKELEENYPTYGDNSEIEYEASSRNQLYLRIDRNKSHLLYGDFTSGFNDTALSAYNRAFNGLSVDSVSGKNKLKAFVSSTSQSQAVDNLQPKGISGYYYLSKAPVVGGSERIVIEVRDRDQADRILERKVMVRWTDYTIDYDLGTIIFKKPVSGFDSDFNPVFIIASYETVSEGNTHYIYGFRNSYAITNALTLGVTAITEEKEIPDYKLFGVDADWRINDNLKMNLEWAATESFFDNNNVGSFDNGSAWSAKLEGNIVSDVKLSAYIRRSGTYFNNPSAVGSSRGRRTHGLKLNKSVNSALTLYGEYFEEDDRIGYKNNKLGLIGANRAFGKSSYSLELLRRESSDVASSIGNQPSLLPFSNNDEMPDRMTGIRFKAQRALSAEVTMMFQHQQDIESDFNRSGIGLNYQVNDATGIYIRDEYGRFKERSENRFRAGIESKISKTTTAFNEYRIDNNKDGSRFEQAFGINKGFRLKSNMTGTVGVETLDTLRGDERNNTEDSFSTSLSLEYDKSERAKMNLKYEFRNSTSEKSYLMETGSTVNVNSEYSLYMNARHNHRGFNNGGYHNKNRFLLGAAYRPLYNSKISFFGKAIFENEKDTSSVNSLVDRNRIISIEEVYQYSKKLQLTGKYAGKWAKHCGSSDYTELLSAGYLFDMNKKIDIGADYRILKSRNADSTTQGGSVQAGYRIMKNLHVSLGYNFDKFDANMTGNDYWGKGVFVRLRLKLDDKSTIKK